MTLVEFLRARLDERADAAQAALDFPYGIPQDAPWWGAQQRVKQGDPSTGYSSTWDQHVALNDPARVLAEVEAKRTRIETYELAIARQRAEQDDYAAWCNNEPHGGSDALNGPDPKLIPGLEYALRCDALPYAAHQDYDPAWRP